MSDEAKKISILALSMVSIEGLAEMFSVEPELKTKLMTSYFLPNKFCFFQCFIWETLQSHLSYNRILAAGKSHRIRPIILNGIIILY